MKIIPILFIALIFTFLAIAQSVDIIETSIDLNVNQGQFTSFDINIQNLGADNITL